MSSDETKKPARKPTPLLRPSLSPLPFGAGGSSHAVDEGNVAQGAKNVVSRCLSARPREVVHLLDYRAGDLLPLFVRAVEDAAATPVVVDVASLMKDGGTIAEHAARLEPLLAGATATILLAPERPPPALSVAIAKAAERQKARHLHLLQVDERLLMTSVRADPDLLSIVNGRLATALEPPCTVRVTSEAGTSLEVQLDPRHPVLASSGRPSPGTSENLPAGHVYVHPYRVSGTVVADRAVFGPALEIDRAALRRHPVRAQFSNGRLSSFEADDEAVRSAIERYLASHVNANRVGLVVFPTNYLVRSEIGSDRQDMLLPGASISMGYASAEATRAPYEAPVQMVLLGRKQTIEVGGRRLVDAGRFDRELVAGTDPFR